VTCCLLGLVDTNATGHIDTGDETTSSDEIASHERSAIAMKLPYLSYAGSTKRGASKHDFPCDLLLSAYDPL